MDSRKLCRRVHDLETPRPLQGCDVPARLELNARFLRVIGRRPARRACVPRWVTKHSAHRRASQHCGHWVVHAPWSRGHRLCSPRAACPLPVRRTAPPMAAMPSPAAITAESHVCMDVIFASRVCASVVRAIRPCNDNPPLHGASKSLVADPFCNGNQAFRAHADVATRQPLVRPRAVVSGLPSLFAIHCLSVACPLLVHCLPRSGGAPRTRSPVAGSAARIRLPKATSFD